MHVVFGSLVEPHEFMVVAVESVLFLVEVASWKFICLLCLLCMFGISVERVEVLFFF
jgi:hypothetical protein